MQHDFDRSIFHSRLVNGRLKDAMSYLALFPSQSELYGRYVSRFQEENYCAYDVAPELNEILLAYQKYYRDAFYLELAPEEAERRLSIRLAELLPAEPGASLDGLEEQTAEAFRSRSLHILTGRTSGYRGPYIWREEELRHYAVELPDGVQDYAVKLLDGFVMLSWLDYLSFGEVGTGGWSNGDGLIHCVKSGYDLDSEAFQVSLLKHEAQHAADHARFRGMSSEELEYRAKLVELICSSQRNLLDRFLLEADGARTGNGHGLAAERIAQGFEKRLNKDRRELSGLPAREVQAAARELFAASSAAMAAKYQ